MRCKQYVFRSLVNIRTLTRVLKVHARI